MLVPLLLIVDGPFIVADSAAFVTPQPIAAVALPDGSVEFEVIPGAVYTIASGRTSPRSYQLTVFIACAADVDNDNDLDPDDFDAWLAAYDDNLPEADLNADGLVCPRDFGAWLAAFNRGCYPS